MTLVVLGRYVNGLEFITVLLGDEPALSPEEQFYHRLLAGDALAASQQLDAASAEQTFVALGDTLPTVPLFLTAARFVNLELEPSYLGAYAGMPVFWRNVIEKRPA